MDEKQIWESWLDEEHSEKLIRIRNAVRHLVDIEEQKYGGLLAYYVPHGIEHFQAVEDLFHRLIPGKRYQNLTLKERYYLLASAWLHDLGMLKVVNHRVYGNIPSHKEIRKNHHRTSEEYIACHWADLEIDEVDKDLFGKLCRYHSRSEDINERDLEEHIVSGHKHRLRLLVSYLRLADSLDVGLSRAPSRSYMECLAYDIPQDARLHWIKCRLINGVHIDPEEHCITLQFRLPEQWKNEVHAEWDSSKLEFIIEFVADDFRDELRRVMNVITRANISFYLDIKVEKTYVPFDAQALNDIGSLVMNYDIMTHPSATRLLEIVILGLANILGFSLSRNGRAAAFQTSQDAIQKIKHGEGFLDLVSENILGSRRCHLGLRELISRCRALLNEKDNLNQVADELAIIYKGYHDNRKKIRKHSQKIFEKLLKEKPLGNELPDLNILLYAYSELVTRALCGLRDFLILKQYPGCEPRKLYNSDIEKEVSNRIRIFVCECQPKTQTDYQDRLSYHDGCQYALYLHRRGFTNLVIIPDIIAGTIFTRIKIDFVLVGANGITDTHFLHSAGHLGIITLARSIPKKPCVILVTTWDKYKGNTGLHDGSSDPDRYKLEGCLFRTIRECGCNRHHIWLTRDDAIFRRVSEGGICLSNPREDCIPISDVDYIITELGGLEVKGKKSEEIIEHFNKLSSS